MTVRPNPTRRTWLQASAALGAALVAPRFVSAQSPVRLVGPAFTLGVASGYPRPDGFTLWTRLAPIPLSLDGGMPPARVRVEVEVARDEAFTQLAARATRLAAPEWAHSVHVDVRGLEPGRVYFYRFVALGEVSPVGRTRTAPAVGARTERLRFATGSCQHFEDGFFVGHRHLAGEDLDLIKQDAVRIRKQWEEKLKAARHLRDLLGSPSLGTA
jgi:alkaline phosphatase D